MADILAVRNVPHEGLGLFEDVLDSRHMTFDVIDHGWKSISYMETGDYDAMLVFGGPASANDNTPEMHEEQLRVDQAIRSFPIPYLGICLGAQVAAVALEGRVEDSAKPEVGFDDEDGEPYTLTLTDEGKADALLANVPDSFETFQLHSQEVTALPKGADILATGKTTKVQIARFGRFAYGIQAHPELTESMLVEWIRQVPELASIGRDRLIEAYEARGKEYRTVGRTIMHNFIDIIVASA